MTSSAAHTAGWFWSGSSLMENHGDHSKRVLSVATAPSDKHAAMIEAAPDLLAAIKARCPYCHADRPIQYENGEAMHHVARGGDLGSYVPCALRIIERAAIAKATGAA